jgi:phosphonate transport system substrate-binding protein
LNKQSSWAALTVSLHFGGNSGFIRTLRWPRPLPRTGWPKIIRNRIMDRLQRLLLAAMIALAVCGILQSAAAADDKPLVMGVFPRVDAVETTRAFLPIANYLSQATGRKFVLETAKDFEAFWRGVVQKRYDLVHYNQYQYLKSHKAQGYQVILKNVEQGRATLAAAIVVRVDSNIHSIADLKSKVIIFGGDRSAMQAYVGTTYLLRKGGLKKGDYEEQFSKNPPNAVLATYFKQADAAGAGDHVLEIPSLERQIDTKQMKYLAVGDQLPHLPWAVKDDMPRELRAKIQEAMVNLNKTAQGRAILARMHYEGFQAATDAEYDMHRQIIKEVLGEDY